MPREIRSHYYVLEGKKVVPCFDVLVWAKMFETLDRVVKQTKVGGVEVSTEFLGIDHNFMGEGTPPVFETMVFGGALDGDMNRYSTWEEAENGHEEMCKKVFGRKWKEVS